MSKLVNSASTFSSTENGALTYSTSGSKVLDLFAQGGALRTRTTEEICKIVDEAYSENSKQTIATLLYIRDIRGGQGEKRTTRVAFNHLKDKLNKDELVKAIVEVGSWKDVFTIFSIDEYKSYVKEIVLKEESSLMYKYLPSIGGSKNKEAEMLAKYLGMTPRQYRKRLTSERAKLNIVEIPMCKNNWNEINYEHVPSKAGLLYRDAFKRHDNDRYSEFIYQAKKADGSVHINTGTLAPYELTGKYVKTAYEGCNIDETVEAMWKNLKDYTDDSNSLVVADTSGSMDGMPMNIATSLAIYFAEHNKGIFHNEFITFSRVPRFYQFEEGMTLRDRVRNMVRMNICENTDLQAVFNLILKTASDNKLSEDDMPKSIIIVSDMELDEAQGRGSWQNSNKPKTNFEAIKEQYADAGYKMPNIVFWNVDSRQDNIPVKMNEQGVMLVSGSSASTFSMVIEGQMDPYQFMLSIINKPRYSEFAEKITNL